MRIDLYRQLFFGRGCFFFSSVGILAAAGNMLSLQVSSSDPLTASCSLSSSTALFIASLPDVTHRTRQLPSPPASLPISLPSATVLEAVSAQPFPSHLPCLADFLSIAHLFFVFTLLISVGINCFQSIPTPCLITLLSRKEELDKQSLPTSRCS